MTLTQALQWAEMNCTPETTERLRSRAVVSVLVEEIERLRQVARNVYDVWAGSEGIPQPETAPEAYLLHLVEQMRDEAKDGLHNVELTGAAPTDSKRSHRRQRNDERKDD